MARNELAVFTTLILVENERGQLLVEDRKDPDWPGICFPGGHVEPGEAFTTAAIREAYEETGLTISDPRLVGVKQFQTKHDERYVVFFYKATKFTGTLTSSDEGEVFWIDREELPESDRYYIEVRGANASADLYVNGKKYAHHDGGYSTWRCDITQEIGIKTMIVLAVDNAPSDTVYPQVADFTFYGGLYRDVNIIGVSESHFDLSYYGGPGIKVTPIVDGKNANVEVEVFVTNGKLGQSIRFTLRDAEGNVVATTTCNDTKVNFTIENVHLWNGRKDPYLYTAAAELVEDETVLDNVSTRFGCRFFEIHPENGFILNGEEYPLRGVSRHQDRWGIGNALLPEHHE